MTKQQITDLQEKLDAAEDRQSIAADLLATAARAYCGHESDENWEELTGAAKRWTNAMHQRSRCEKHIRDEVRS